MNAVHVINTRYLIKYAAKFVTVMSYASMTINKYRHMNLQFTEYHMSYLTCFMRKGFQSVPGCLGAGEYGKDYDCYNPQKPNALTSLANKQKKHSESFPLGECK
jgi:hypothetical protein